MDAFTAGSLLIVSKFGVAVVMVTFFCLMPRERCTLDWALAAALIAAGAAVTMANAGAPRFPILLVGNASIILGMVMQWRGIRAFFKRTHGSVGWVIFALFLAGYVWLLASGAPVASRAILLSGAILVMLVVNAYEFASGYRSSKSIGSALAVFSASLLVVCYVVNIVLSSLGLMDFSHSTTSQLTISMIYLLPAGGSMLLTIGIMILLFERHKLLVAAGDQNTLPGPHTS